MKDKTEQALNSLHESFDRVIFYHATEYNMSYQEIIGALEVIKKDLLDDMKAQEIDDGEPDSNSDAS